MKICSNNDCRTINPEFYVNRRTIDGLTSRCKQCICQYNRSEKGKQRTSKYKKSVKGKQANKHWYTSKKCRDGTRLAYNRRAGTLEGYTKCLIRLARQRVKAFGIDMNIEYTDLIDLWNKQNGLCAISGVGMTYGRGNGHTNTACSVDRIIPALGYTKGNIRLVCYIINVMRHNLDDMTFLSWVTRTKEGLEKSVKIL